MRKLFTTLAAVLAAQSVGAQSGGFAAPEKSAVVSPSGISSMGQVTLALLIVLAVLFAAAWAMRQFKFFNRPGQGALEVLQGISLGPKERAVLIRVNDRRLLLGVAPGCVNLLLELPASDAVTERDGDAPAPGAPETPNFKALLKRSMGIS